MSPRLIAAVGTQPYFLGMFTATCTRGVVYMGIEKPFSLTPSRNCKSARILRILEKKEGRGEIPGKVGTEIKVIDVCPPCIIPL